MPQPEQPRPERAQPERTRPDDPRPERNGPREPRLTGAAAVALTLIVSCEFALQLDTTIMNVALPTIRRELGFRETDLAWVVNAFLLAFGGLLLLGGRAGDLLGHRRVFVTGTALFTLASALGGLSTTAETLVAARALQGVGAALAAPTGIALLAHNFPEGPLRTRAFAVFSAAASSGLSLGLVFGGLLTSGLSWRWVLFVNIPVGVLVLLLTPRFVAETERQAGRFDLAGALSSTLGTTALVYGFVRVSEEGWSAAPALVSFAAGATLMAAFLVVESRAARPILPLRLFRSRTRAGAYANLLLLAATLTSLWFFLAQYLQGVLALNALETGLAFLPMAFAVLASSQTAPRLLPLIGTRWVGATGFALIAAATAWLSLLTPESGYAAHVLGPLVIAGLGAGLVTVSHNLTIMSDLPPQDSGAASGALQAMLTVGGSLGLAVLVTVFGTALRAAERAGQEQQALSEGVTAALGTASVLSVLALLIAVFALRPVRGRR